MQSIRTELQKILRSPNPEQLIKELACPGLTEQQIASFEAQGQKVYRGKVREVIQKNREELLVFHSDRLTAFDRLIGLIPFKGQILADISDFWFSKIRGVIPNHYKKRVDDRTLLVESLTPIKAEVIVRGYMAGSLARAYEKGERLFCGVRFADGLKTHRELPRPVITQTTKAAAFEHDEDVSSDELIKRGVCTADEWDQINSLAFKLFEFGRNVLEEKGWILVDTKYEFGKTAEGEIKVMDEIHTPDSSRFWVADSYERNLSANKAPDMLDKENVRRYLLSQGFSGHGDVPPVPAAELVKLVEIYLDVAEKLRSIK